jgi:hypothetical protein
MLLIDWKSIIVNYMLSIWLNIRRSPPAASAVVNINMHWRRCGCDAYTYHIVWIPNDTHLLGCRK